MNKKLFYIVSTLVLFTLIMSACSGTAATATPATTAEPTSVPAVAPRSIVLGDVSADPAKKIKAFQPLADYLAANLGQFGVTAGEVMIAPDQETMIKWLKDGTVDVYFATPYLAMIMNDRAGAQIVLRRWKSGVAEYKSLIFVRKDSGIKSLSDLKGHMIAFDDPTSTTAYMMPLAYMLEAGLKVTGKTGADSSVAPDEVGYVFANGQSNVTDWLLTRRVSAGAFSDQDIKDFPADVMDQLVVLVESEKMPRSLVVARPGIDPSEMAAIKTLLVGLDQAPEGPDILKTFEKTAKFDELPNLDAVLARLRELYQLTTNQ